MFVLFLLAGLLAAGLLYQGLGAYRDAHRYIAPGRIVDIDCARLHLNEQGASRPAVVLESGIVASSISWALVQPKIAEFTRVCSYDRAGLGWSAACSTPRTVEQMVSELKTLLARAQIPSPYILIGHSFGGLLIRAYAHRSPEEVAGLVFVDPVSLEYWAGCSAAERRRLTRGVKLSRRGALLARLGIVRVALAALASGGRRFPKFVARASAGQGTRVMEGIAGEIQKLPRELWPMIRAHWSRPKCFSAMALYLESLPESARAALAMPIPGQIPFIILSASNATEDELKERDSWLNASGRGRHIRVENSGHWIQLERPAVVVEAVREMVGLL